MSGFLSTSFLRIFTILSVPLHQLVPHLQEGLTSAALPVSLASFLFVKPPDPTVPAGG